MLENVETIKSDIEITKQNIAEPSDEWKDIVYHKYMMIEQAMSVCLVTIVLMNI